ncbi:MAG TPA: TolC family protein [Planctomycetota bacterium]|nr:TolC family protein [Planctomycetota bacterium]
MRALAGLALVLASCGSPRSFTALDLPPLAAGALPAAPAAEPDRLTLSRCIGLAVARSDRARGYAEDTVQESERRGLASAARWPELAAAGTYFIQQTTGSSVNSFGQSLNDDRSEARALMRWDPTELLRRGPEMRRFEKLRDSWEQMRRDAEGSAALDAAAAFYAVSVAQRRLESARARAGRDEFALAEAEARNRQEISAMSAVAERKLEALRSRREIYAAELDLDRAWTELRSLTRLSGSPELVDDLDLAGADRPAAAWAEQAARSHPALLAARSRRQAAEQELASAQLWWVPSLNLQVAQYLHREGFGSDSKWDASATLEFPLTGMIAAGHEIAIAESKIRQSDLEIERVSLDLAKRVELALQDLKSAERLMELVGETVSAAEVALEDSRERLRLGMATRSLEVDAEAILREARWEELAAQAIRRLSLLRLKVLAGAGLP